MSLAIFDLDNTLLGGDSDHAWGEFLIRLGVVDGDAHRRANDEYFRQYQRGELDIYEYQAFAMQVLTRFDPEQLAAWQRQFVAEVIDPLRLPKADALLAEHRSQGDTLLIITATNRFVTGPIAESLGVEHLLATEPELLEGRYTGRVAGIPCYREGKVTRLQEWLKSRPETLEGSYFYSDSHNDLPLLEMVAHPVAVDPDDTLRDVAESRGWRVMSLR